MLLFYNDIAKSADKSEFAIERRPKSASTVSFAVHILTYISSVWNPFTMHLLHRHLS